MGDRCFACGGPYHEASGHLIRDFGLTYCGPCWRHFMAWVKKHTSPRRGPDFYAEAATSIRATSGTTPADPGACTMRAWEPASS